MEYATTRSVNSKLAKTHIVKMAQSPELEPNFQKCSQLVLTSTVGQHMILAYDARFQNFSEFLRYIDTYY